MFDKRSVLVFCSVVTAVFFAMGCEDAPETYQLEGTDDLALAVNANGLASIESDHIFTSEHMVEMPDGAELHIIEKFSVRSFFTFPRRALLMLTPTFVTNEFYDADINGDLSYNAMDRMAEAGFFAFAVSYEGYGESSHPVDGREVTFEKTLAQMGYLVELIRYARLAAKVDIIGGSMGSSLAIALGGVDSPISADHVGRIVLTSFVYNRFSPFIEENFFTPELMALLSSLPYIETAPEMYGTVLNATEPHVFAWATSTFPGVYATGPTLEGFDLPIVAAQDGRAPALQIWGTADLMHTEEDVALFQAEYGGPVDLMTVDGGAHSPLIEPARDAIFDRILAFLEI